VLLTQILSVLSDGHDGNGDEDPEGQNTAPRKSGQDAEDVGIEYRSLYQKASEELIYSSDMNFRFLLKEFHDESDDHFFKRREWDGSSWSAACKGRDGRCLKRFWYLGEHTQCLHF
jgi:hypothetical protein